MSLKFIRPHSLEEALENLARHGGEAKALAGGTAVVLMITQKLIAPQVLVSLDRLPGLDFLQPESEGLRLGPMVRLRDVARSSLARERYPALAQACSEVGNVRIQNQATLGGNLAEADYASDPPAVLLALEATLTVSKMSGSRQVPLGEFFHGFYTTDLQVDELITEVYIPSIPEGTRMTYLKFKSRSSEDRPCVGVAAVASFLDGVCRDLRVAVGAACEVPRRLPEIEAWAKGYPLSEELINEIAEAYAANLETLDDLRGSSWYRSQMVRVQMRRALMEVRDGSR